MRDQDDLDPVLAGLYDAERAAPLPEGATARVLAGVLTAVSVSATATAASAAAGHAAATGHAAASATGHAAASVARTTAGLSTRAVVAIAVGSAVGGGAVGAIGSRMLAPPPAPARQVAPAPPVTPPAPPDAPAPASPPTDAVAPAAAPAAAPIDAKPPGRSPAGRGATPADSREALLVDRGRAALRRGLVDEALATLMRHERLFPRGELAEERDVLVIEAYVAKGDAVHARRRIAAYRHAYPGGFLRERVDRAEAALAGTPGP